MASPRFAWGIDIGNRALKAVKLVRDGDRLRVDDFEFIEHETILSQAGDNREALMQTALANFVQRHAFKNGVVSVGVSGSSSFARFVKLPPVEEKKIPEIVRFEAIQQIPFPLEDVEWSYQLFRQPENPEVEVGIFAMRRELVNQHIKYFTDFDLNVQTVQMNPLAVYNALQFDGRLNDGTTMVIDVGSENTDLLICSNDSIWMRSIPIGGNNFTESLVKAFKLTFAKAEDLKRNAATSKYARQIFQAMRPIFADLVAEIQRSIGFYSSVHRDTRIAKIVALGGTFRLPGLQKYLQQNLQLDVEKIDTLGAGTPEDPKLAAIFDENLLSIVGPYGLAVQAMGDGVVTSSLLPRAIQKERIWQEKTKWFGTAAALCLLVPTIAGSRYFYENLRFENNAPVRTKIDSALATGKSLDSEWSAIQTAGGPEKARIANLNTVNDLKTVWRDLLTDLTAAVPRPPAALQTALDSGDKTALLKTPRDQRAYMRIDQLSSRYDAELATHVADARFDPAAGLAGRGGPMAGMTAAPAGETPAAGAANTTTGEGRGFVITLRMTTPENGTATLEEMKKAVLAITPSAGRPNMKYSVAKWWLLSATQVEFNTERKAKLLADYNAVAAAAKGLEIPPGSGLGGLTGGFGTPVNPPPAVPGGFLGGADTTGDPAAAPVTPLNPEEEAYKDPVTGEPILKDWEFVVAIAVVLDPKPYVPPEPAAAPAGATASAK